MQKKGFSSIGHLEATDFAYGNGKVEGELTTNGEADFFGEKWAVNLKFVAPLGEIPKESQVAESPKEAAVRSSATEEEPDKEMESKPAAGAPKAHELALTKDATDVEYKELVEQLEFKSKSDVKSVCKELAANLKGQGWSNDGPDLVNPNSSILKRQHGAATLTIFVKPANGGSEVKVMTEGLSWDAQ
jgi:hypothetical protein